MWVSASLSTLLVVYYDWKFNNIIGCKVLVFATLAICCTYLLVTIRRACDLQCTYFLQCTAGHPLFPHTGISLCLDFNYFKSHSFTASSSARQQQSIVEEYCRQYQLNPSCTDLWSQSQSGSRDGACWDKIDLWWIGKEFRSKWNLWNINVTQC